VTKHSSQIDRVQQIKEVTEDRQVPGANVLVAAIDGFPWGADSLLTLVNLMDEAFAIPLAHNDVVPKGQQFHIQPSES